MKRNWKKLVLIVGLVLFVAIQLVPVSWLVAHDVEEARAELREEIWEEVEEGEMPLPIYRFMHSDARLSRDQLDTLREWATASSGGETASSGRHD